MIEFHSKERDASQSKEIESWNNDLSVQTAAILKELEEKLTQMETFDLLSNIACYNQLYESENYTDYRGDKMFVVSELIALIALKSEYVLTSNVDVVNAPLLFKEIQSLGSRYFGMISLLFRNDENFSDEFSISGITSRMKSDETTIRNTALPEHYRLFTKEIYGPLDVDIKNNFGFSVKEGLELGAAVSGLINEKFNNGRDSVEPIAVDLIREVFRYRASGCFVENSSFPKEAFEQLSKLSRKDIRQACFNYAFNMMGFQLGKVFCFSSSDLAKYIGFDLSIVDSFIKQFSCHFPCVKNGYPIVVGPTTILRSKPLVEFNGRILVPSLPLLTACIEPLVDNFINSSQKLQNRFKNLKHDFLLKKGVELFSAIFNGGTEIFTNLFYHKDDDLSNRYETDGIFKYERTLYILEAKGNKISSKAKEGKIERMERHLGQIVRDSYEQGLRTLDYIKSKPSVSFLIDKKKIIEFNQSDFDDIVLISLTLEPIGNITPLIRESNETGYFKRNIFPWIVSIYDLQVIADHFDFPVLLPHYIKRRREFLSNNIMQVFEETDLLSYYLFNRLYIDNILQNAEAEKANLVYMGNETDEINNYYEHKYRLKNPNPPKLRLRMPEIFSKILSSLENTTFNHRQELMLGILDLSPDSMEEFEINIKKIKNLFAKDSKIHNCSILTNIKKKR